MKEGEGREGGRGGGLEGGSVQDGMKQCWHGRRCVRPGERGICGVGEKGQ
jgi:hypothetical protein